MAKTVAVNVQLTTKQAQENVDELNKSFEAQEDLIESLESDLRKYEKQLGETTGREVARRSKLNEKIKETKNRLNEEKAGLKTINNSRA
jgi:CRISPR/Cas system CSM-associated protein Csm2 small subunit